jgi:hypothetical protein
MASGLRWFVLPGLLVDLAALGLLCLPGQPLTAQDKAKGLAPKANVFVHPEKLTVKDKLTDGGKGTPIEIKSETTLIWVDLAPDARFAHPTEYVLISAEGTRVVKGTWWPVLNGKALFRDGKPYKADFPMNLTGK